MFGKHRRELESAIEAARDLLTSDNLVEMQRVAAIAREASFGLTGPTPNGLEVIEQLEDRVELLNQQRVAESLRPCGNCTAHAFRISRERDVEAGRGRLVVCAGCGLVTVYVSRVDELASDQFGPTFEAPPGPTPYR